MTGPTNRLVRPPAVAGMFYPADADACRSLVREYSVVREDALAGKITWRGALVPHAGWVCSGPIAGEAIATLARSTPADVVVVFGAIHTQFAPPAAGMLDSHTAWSLPVSDVELSRDLTRRLEGSSKLFVDDDRFHDREHAVEVELPFVAKAWPGAMVLPIEVAMTDDAIQVGLETARHIRAAGLRAVYLASSDLTHYGPEYRFTPGGVGPAGLAWAKHNDQRLLRLVTELKAHEIVPEVKGRLNACGGGAIAAMLASCGEEGATRSLLLRHANSVEMLAEVAQRPPVNAVGYAGVLIG